MILLLIVVVVIKASVLVKLTVKPSENFALKENFKLYLTQPIPSNSTWLSLSSEIILQLSSIPGS
jgi:hypothetical protein